MIKELTFTIAPGKNWDKDAGDDRIFSQQTRDRMGPMFERTYSSIQEIVNDLHNRGVSPSIHIVPRRVYSLESIERGEWPNNTWPIVYTTHEDCEIAVINIRNGSK